MTLLKHPPTHRTLLGNKMWPVNILDSDLSGEQLFLLWARWGARKELEAVLVCEECTVGYFIQTCLHLILLSAQWLPQISGDGGYGCLSTHMFVSSISFFFSLLVAAQDLCCCMRTFSSCGEQGLLSSCSAQASHCGGFPCWGVRALGVWAL